MCKLGDDATSNFFGFLNSCDTKHGKEGHAARRPKVHLLSLLKVDIDHH